MRSIAAHLAGDHTAADEVRLVLPQTADHPTGTELETDQVEAAHAAPTNGKPWVGFATDVADGRSAELSLTP